MNALGRQYALAGAWTAAGLSAGKMPCGREAAMARPPVFVMAQTACLTCGAEIADPLTLETLGRFCSQRCYHARGLPVLRRMGA